MTRALRALRAVGSSGGLLQGVARKRPHSRCSDSVVRTMSVLSTLARWQVGVVPSYEDQKPRSHLALPRIAVLPLSTHNAFSTQPPAGSSSKDRDGDDDTAAPPAGGRMADLRRGARDRAAHLRGAARDSYAHFREDPRSRTAAGARSVYGMVQQYGPVFVVTYMGVYFTTLGLLFAGVESGLMDPAGLFNLLGHATTDGAAQGETISTVQYAVDFMRRHALLAPYAHFVERNPSIANLAVAWIAVKFTEPARLAVAVAVTPRIARYFGYAKRREDKEEDGDIGRD